MEPHPSRSTDVDSMITKPGFDTASDPRCWSCQRVAAPLLPMYCAIGDTAMRLAYVAPRMENGEKSIELKFQSSLATVARTHEAGIRNANQDGMANNFVFNMVR